MTRALWTLLVVGTWLRSKLAARSARVAERVWIDADDGKRRLKPGPKDSIEAHVKHAIASNEIDKLEARAKLRATRAAKRFKTYARVRDFGPRWVWSYVPYAEVIAAGMGVGWMAHHQPEVLSHWTGHAVSLAGRAWAYVAGVA